MSDPTPDDSLLARQLAKALHLPNWDELSDAELEQFLDNAEPEPISKSQHEKIVNHAQRLIRQWETKTMATLSDDMRSESPLRQAVASGAKSNTSARSTRKGTANRQGSGSAVILAGLALLAMAILVVQSSSRPAKTTATTDQTVAPVEYLPPGALVSSSKPAPAPIMQVAVGSTIETKARERRRVTLPDGSTLFLNQDTKVRVESERKLMVEAGEVFVEVMPHQLIEGKEPFVVNTPQKSVTALGTKFLVKADKAETGVIVTQGKVQVSGIEEPLTAGQELTEDECRPAPRFSEALLWTKDLMAAAESPLIPKNEHAGGVLVAIDPNGQEMSLALRKQHIDVHIEDGFARTTIDQTYFNASWSQMEGTFYFPLPVDASLSRLAMYVGENLMEGGMAERDHARNVFEQIRYTRRDPALLEWVDGSTFKMRVFPLEARQEKRIIMSYTQRLKSAYGKLHYRFPAGHSLELIRDWSTHVLVKNHVGYQWSSPSHLLRSKIEGEDLILESTSEGIADEKDLVIELEDAQGTNPKGDTARFTRMLHEGQQYLMLRFRPDLKGELKRKPRNWVFLFESAGNRDALLGRVQIEVLETLLKNAEHDDTFSIITAASRATAWKEQPTLCTLENIEAAVKRLNEVHLIGALDLGNALAACQPFVDSKPKDKPETYLVHLGAGVAVLGETETETLLRRLPEGAKYVGIGVGKRWSESFMKAAANKTGGHITQINPDEVISWRSLELLSLLNSPRVLNLTVKADGSAARFLQYSDTLAQGEELCAITRLEGNAELPKSLTITGQLAGKSYEKTIPVEKIAEEAGYLPRTWAKLEIDHLVASGAEEHKQEIITLSKAMYVMSPFTSLLVLETEEMYQQFNVDRGRKDHWALYPCPPKIPVVYEPEGRPVTKTVSKTQRAKTTEDLLKTVLVRIPPTAFRAQNGWHYVTQGLSVMQLYSGAIAAPIGQPKYLNYWGFAPQTGGGAAPLVYYDMYYAMPQSGRILGAPVMLDGTVPMQGLGLDPNFGNVWWEDTSGGIRQFATDEVRILNSGSDMNATMLWTRPQLFGSTPARMDFDFSYEVLNPVPQIAEFDGEMPLHRGWIVDVNGRFNEDSTRGRFHPLGLDYGLIVSERDRIAEGFAFNDINGPVTFTTKFSGLGYVNGGEAFGSQLDFLAIRDRIPTSARYILDLQEDGFINPNALPFYPMNGTIVGQAPMGRYRGGYGLFGEPLQWNASHWPLGRFGDLMVHAPGLNTLSVDVQSLLESQGPAELLPKRGTIDPKAQELIERAREGGWEAVTLPNGKGETLTIRCDGQGRYVYERTVSEGLKERVVCDGESLLHLYEELGLAGQRSVSRFHRADIQKLIPWLVPPAEDLAVGFDVRLAGKNSIALVPLQNEKSKTGLEASSVYLLMVFREDGSLQERQVVDAKTNTPHLTVKYGTDGLVEVIGKDDKLIGKLEWTRSVADAPNLTPDRKDLVVLSLPFRSMESLLTAEEQQLANNSQFESFDEETALALVGSYHGGGNFSQLANLLAQRYFGKEDHRIGFYVLLASGYQTTGYGNPAPQLAQKHPNSPLAEYLAQHFQWLASGDSNQVFVVSGDKDGFVQRLALARNVFARWSTGQAVNNRSATDIQLERSRDLDSLKLLQSPELAWMILLTMQKAEADSQALADYIKAADEFAKTSGLSYAARYRAAHWRSELGETAEAMKELEALSNELLDAGVLPPITELTRDGFIHHAGLKAWANYLESLQAQFLKDDQRHAGLVVAIRAAKIKKDALSDSLLAKALNDLSPEKDPRAALLAVGYLTEQNEFTKAETLIAPLLKAEGWSKEPELWRKASDIASSMKQEALSVARLERAMQLEYEMLPDLINLQRIRDDYANLLSRLEDLAGAKGPEPDLKARAIRVADRWRVLDPNDTAACQAAGRIMAKLGDEALAWDYLTTPLADKPNESAPWLALAQELANQQKVDWADRAYRYAFKAESTNAEILWNHAEFLRQHDRMEDAQELLEQITGGNWQPRFDQIKAQAQQRLNEANAPKPDAPK